MELQKRQDQGFPEKKGQKRKLEEELEEESEISAPPTGDAREALLAEVTAQVHILDSAFSWKEADRAAAKRATHVLAELAKNGKICSSSLPSDLVVLCCVYLTFIKYYGGVLLRFCPFIVCVCVCLVVRNSCFLFGV